MKKKIKIREWIIFTEGGAKAIPYILDLSNADVTDDEICLCVSKQIYS